MPINLVDTINGYNYGPTVSCPIGGPSTSGGGGNPGGGGTSTSPVVVNFTKIPDGVVGQETVYNLNISGTPPFSVTMTLPPEISTLAKIVDIPGGTKQFRCVAPFEGNTSDSIKTIIFTIWNSDPTTNESYPVFATVTWTIHPAGVNASWGSTTNALPAAEVGVPYAFYASGVTGTNPYTFARTAGVTTTQLQNAGLAINQGSIVDVTSSSIIIGTPLPGSEGLGLAAPITLGVTGSTGVQATLQFPQGITIYRTPAITLDAIPTFTANGSVNFSQYMVGYPTPNITLAQGQSLPAKFTLTNNTLTSSGLTSGDNGTSSPILFVISDGYHTPVNVSYAISVNIAGTQLNVCPGSTISVSKNATANTTGTVISSLTNGTEITQIFDIGSGLPCFNTTDGAGAAHTGAIFDSTSVSMGFRNGTGETNRQSLGFYRTIGLGAKWAVFRIRMPDTQIAGESCVFVFGPSYLSFTKDAGAGGTDKFYLKTGTATLTSMDIDAIGNFINLLVYIVDQNTAGFAYATGGTITADTGNTTVANIDSAWDRMIATPSFMQAADFDIQCVAYGTGLLS